MIYIDKEETPFTATIAIPATSGGLFDVDFGIIDGGDAFTTEWNDTIIDGGDAYTIQFDELNGGQAFNGGITVVLTHSASRKRYTFNIDSIVKYHYCYHVDLYFDETPLVGQYHIRAISGSAMLYYGLLEIR